jgi:hypothetical protein
MSAAGVPPAAGPGRRDSVTSGEGLTYQGSRFPWWLTILWIGFALWGLIYMVRYFLPDLRAWLVR